MICPPQSCNCAFESETLNISVVDGVVTIEQAEFTSITELENAVANIEAVLASLPATYVDVTGDNMTGGLMVNGSDYGLAVKRQAVDAPFIAFYPIEGARLGYIQASAPLDRFIFNAENIADIQFIAGATTRLWIDSSGVVLFNKTASSINVAGVETSPNGAVTVTRADGLVTMQHNKIGAGVSSSTGFESYKLANTQIGSITRNAATSAVLYNTTSDEDQKQNIEDLDDELALYWLRITQPFLFEYKDFPSTSSEHATQVGYIAQRLAAAWPEAIAMGVVTPGWGNIEDRTWDLDGNETTPEHVWKGWEVDYSKFTPLLHGAVRALDNRQQLHEQAIAALVEQHQADIDTLVARIEALEAAA